MYSIVNFETRNKRNVVYLIDTLIIACALLSTLQPSWPLRGSIKMTEAP